jgi:hypothetical protein
MPLSELSWSDWAGIIGAITGVPALFIQIIQHVHSKPRLRVEITPECIVIRDEFKVQDDKDPDATGYRYATHVVITNVGQMTAVILKVEMCAKNYKWPDNLLNRVPFRKKNHCMIKSHVNAIVDQSYKTPFTLDAGHAWIGIIDPGHFRDTLHQFPDVYLEIKASHKKKSQITQVKLNA